MLGSAGRSEFFAREAADYLRALEPLLGESTPQGDTFVRLARALRGAAMLAGPASYTRAASLLEQIARRAQDPGFAWDDALPRLREAHQAFTRLTSRATSWDATLDTDADALTARLGEIGTSSPAQAVVSAQPSTEKSDQSIRQFVGREAAAVAGALRDAAHGLTAAEMPSFERLGRVSETMHSLRGLAGLTELAPLADLLDATDTAIRELLRYPALPAGAAELCLNGAEAFGRIARDVASRGRTDPELPEAHRFADQLRQVLNGPDSVVPIDDLDGGSALLRRSEPRFAEPLDLSSLGERMRAGADQLRAAPCRAAGRLHALVLLALLRDAPGGLGRRPAGAFIARICNALDDAASAGDPAALSGLLEDAGTILVEGARSDLVVVEESLATLGDGVEVVAIETLLEEEAAVVEIDSLAPDIERPSLDLPADRTPLERSLSVYSRLVRQGAPLTQLELPEPEAVSIESLAPDADETSSPRDLDTWDEPVAIESLAPELDLELEIVGIADLAPDAFETSRPRDLETWDEVVPIEALAPEPDESWRPRDLETSINGLAPEPELLPILMSLPREPLPADGSIIPIENLLYNGDGALARADEVRRLLEASLQMATTELDRVEPLVRELLDLVPLALVGAD